MREPSGRGRPAVNSGKTHYDVMELPREATPDEIRHRFRELARKYHPDHHREHPEYHDVFVRITQAYQILSDESKRAAYDLDLRQAERRQQDLRGAGYGAGPNGTRTTTGASSRPSPGAQRPNAGNQAQVELSRRREASRRKLEEAKYQYLRGNLRESKRLCTEGLEYARMGELYELLGDIAARQKRLDRAVEHYTVAAQMLPTNGLIMAKLNRVMERQGPASRRSRPSRSSARSLAGASFRVGLCICGLALVILLCLVWPALGSERLEIFPVRSWTYPQIFFMIFAGLAAGTTLAIAGMLGAVQDELVVTPPSGNRPPFPVGVILGLFGMVFLPLAFIAYLVVSFRAQSLSMSVMALFGTATVLMLVFATVAMGDAQGETLLFGGNVVFVSMLAGWIFGDLFRPRWA